MLILVNIKKKMVALGFEPRHLSVMGLESIALDHSAKLPSDSFKELKKYQ